MAKVLNWYALKAQAYAAEFSGLLGVGLASAERSAELGLASAALFLYGRIANDFLNSTRVFDELTLEEVIEKAGLPNEENERER